MILRKATDTSYSDYGVLREDTIQGIDAAGPRQTLEVGAAAAHVGDAVSGP